ncbi:MAG: glutamate--tRNA ligase [Holosporales bacterium]
MSIHPVLRFAPSPTGLLHIGNARTCLINWAYARHVGGDLILRLDDTDLERSREEYAVALQEDLRWLGVDWQRYEKQSARLDRYALAAEALKKSGRLYPCYERPEELELKRKLALTQGKPPLYDRAALQLTEDERRKLEAEGRKPHWRFKLLPGEIQWNDLVHGTLKFDASNLSDPVLVREDGMPVYTLSSVVDDHEMGVTHILRAEDHITNTAIQIQLFEALSGTPCALTFGHFPLVVDAQGEKLSKRLGTLGLRELGANGIEPLALASYLLTLGTSDDIHAFGTVAELIAAYDVEKFSKSSPRFNMEDLDRINQRYLHALPFSLVQDRIELCDLRPSVDEAFWSVVRGNLTTLKDIHHWHQAAYGQITPIIEEHDYVAQALDLLPQAPWDETTWKTWTSALASATGRKGRTLFMPLRQALTGEAHGPEMQFFLPYIGYEKARCRLMGQTA